MKHTKIIKTKIIKNILRLAKLHGCVSHEM